MMIKIAVIGAGIFVRDTYLPNISANPERAILTAILSRSLKSIEDTLKICKDQGKNVQKFIGSEGEEEFFALAKDICDAVIIAVPIPLLGKYVARCLSLGISILSEKPVAMTSTEAVKLISMYREQEFHRGARWHVAENYRLEPAVQYASDLVKQHPTKPKTFSLVALRQQSPDSKYATTSWRSKPEYNGSFVLDGGIHFVALLRSIMGEVVRDISSVYEEQNVCEVGACGSCRIGAALGTFQIRYGAFPHVVCRLDVYWDDATMSIIQHKGVGYEVTMTGQETQRFGFEGLETEFRLWLDTIIGAEGRELLLQLTPEESLIDLRIIEAMCGTRL